MTAAGPLLLLDTNVLVALIRENPLGRRIENTIKDFDPLDPTFLQRVWIDPGADS